LKPPVPAIRNKIMHFANPRVFDENVDDKNMENYFNGWSFIKNN
jgi:hypothetical protein